MLVVPMGLPFLTVLADNPSPTWMPSHSRLILCLSMGIQEVNRAPVWASDDSLLGSSAQRATVLAQGEATCFA